MDSSIQINSLYKIIKWYLLAAVLNGVYGIIMSLYYNTNFMSDSQELYLTLFIDITVTFLYFVALKKTFSACKEMPNK